MLRVQQKHFSTVSILAAAAAPAKKAQKQGFAKKNVSAKSNSKKISPGSLYKKWRPTMATGGFNKNAKNVELPSFALNSSINEITSFTKEQYQLLYRLGSFKQDQFNELFPRPIALSRQETTQKFYDLLRNSESRRFILTGEPGVGKSTLLAQIQAYALTEKAIIVNISHPELFLNGRNDFFLDGEHYVQPMCLKSLMTKVLKANNSELLSSVKLAKEHTFSNSLTRDSTVWKSVALKAGSNTLLDLLSLKTSVRNRGKQFQAVLEELTSQEAAPVYFTVDNFSRILSGPFSAYKDVNNKNIHVLDLQIGKAIMDVVSGAKNFKHKQSCVVLATSGNDRTNRTISIGLGRLPHDPYLTRYHYEPIFSELMKKGGVQEFVVPKLSKEDVHKLVKFYKDSEILLEKDLNSKSIDQLADAKYFLSGNGNPRELLKSIILNPF